ncbi:MAG: S8 family serine peptidase [Ignavibacteria bacterium]|nr:S8 family serine peptidase [Ignavibacteria bacterium]
MRKYILISLMFLFASGLYSQNQKIVFKLKKDTPQSVINDTKLNIPSSNSPANILNNYGVSKVDVLFSKSLTFLSAKDKNDFGLDKIFTARIISGRPSDAVKALKENRYIEYAEIVNICKLESSAFTPNDTYFGSQYYLNSINILSLYGQADATGVLIGVIDSGLDFLHPDLQQSYYINPGEYGNGKESNGIDDDGNGFIDDWRGWNFIDNNNNPADDNIFSHGSSVTGIISAGYNNNTGITPVAPNSKCLELKCFDSQGQGFEDNVSTAILYGITQSVNIFNFSFGDYIYSNLIRDVIKYAYSRNITMICSAGNDNSDVLHYPSAFDEVISVGASDEIDRKATFSAFGQTVDIFAPGVNILTTSRMGYGSPEYGNNYQQANGTSFSTPVIVGVAALLKAKNPSLTNEEIRGILISSTRYFPGQNGWDYTYASGIADADKSYQNYSNPSAARIYFPYLNNYLTNYVPICISAASAFFRSYSLSYGIGMNPSSMTELFSSTSQAMRDTVYRWRTDMMPDTTYTLKLAINTASGRTIEHRTIVKKDFSSPVIGAYDNKEIIYSGNYAERIRFISNVPTTGIVHYKRKNITEPYNFIYADESNIGFVSTEHFAYLKHNSLSVNTQYEYYIEIVSPGGRNAIINDTSFVFTAKGQINPYGYIKKPYNLPHSQVCNTVVSVLNNGQNSLITNNIKNSLNTEAYNFTTNKFEKISPSPWLDNNVARDITDINNNGKLDLLTSQQRNGFIYESPSSGTLPSVKIWNSDAVDDFWSARFADADEDGAKEILGFGKTGLRILKYQSGVMPFAVLPYYPQNGSDYANSQNVLTGDYNNNGKTDIVFTNNFFDSSGGQNTTINVFEHSSGANYNRVLNANYISLIMKGDNLIDGDFDGDGKKEFAVGLSSDSRTPLKLFVLLIYKFVNNQYTEIAELEFYNNYSGESFCKAGDIDNDGKDEIILNFDKNLYVIKYVNGNYQSVYYAGNYSSYNGIIYDFDNNGIKEIGLNNNDSLIFIEKDIQFTGPLTPSNFSGYSTDSNRVLLSFLPVQSADYYRIYRGSSDSTGYALYDSTVTSSYTDVNVTNKRDYYYKVSAVSNANTVKESKLSVYTKVYVHNKSKLINCSYSQGFLMLSFSENIALQIPELNKFKINGSIMPSTVGVKDKNTYALSFSPGLANGTYTVKTTGLNDFYGSPVDSNAMGFIANTSDSASFYLTSLAISGNILKVEFNMNVDSISYSNLSNYIFEPFNLKVISAVRDANNKKVLYLGINGNNIGASGKTYFLRISNLYSENGKLISSGSGSVFSLSFVKEDLSNVVVYPNPYNGKTSVNKKIMFANLTKTAVITIYNLSGEYVNQLKGTSETGGLEWDVRDSKGNDIPTGIYIFKAEGKNSLGISVDDKTGKFAVIK